MSIAAAHANPGLASASSGTDHTRVPPHIPDHRLLRCVGGGSYGEVWLARNVMGTYRAVKIIYRQNFPDPQPFEREFHGIQKFEPISRLHEGLIDILQIGHSPADGYFYYVMELADDLQSGQQIDPDKYEPKTLQREAARRGALPPSECVALGLSLTNALGDLHRHGLVHRDIKPSNIVFVNGAPKLADIGLVTGLDATRSIVGTKGFIAPEGPGSRQADIYSLGKVLYEMCTGKDREQFPDLPTDMRTSAKREELLELNEVLVKACATDSGKRYQTVAEMLADLALLQSGRSVKRLRVVERRLAILTRVGVLMALLAIIASAILYESNRQRRVATRNLVRLHVANGTRLMNEGDLFSSLLCFTEALRLDTGDSTREEPHRIRIASVLRECPKLAGVFTHEGAIKQAAFSPDSRRLITASEDQTARVWDLTTGLQRFSLVHSGQVDSAAFSPDGKLIATTSSPDNKVHVWSAETGQPLHHHLIRHYAWNVGPHPRFSPDGDRILTLEPFIARDTLQIWKVVTGEPVGQPLQHDHEVSFYAFSADGGQIVTISGDNRASVWNAFTGEKIFSFPHSGAVNCAAFSPDNRILATGGDDNYVRFWDLSSGNVFAQPLLHRGPVDSLSFSPEGRRLVTACRNNTVEVWDVVTGAPLLSRPLQLELKVFNANFNPDGTRIVTASQGNLVRTWDAGTGELLAPPLRHNTPRGHAQISPDGHLVLTMQRNEAVRVWSVARVGPQPWPIQPTAVFRERSVSVGGRFKAILNGGTIQAYDDCVGDALPPLIQTIPFRQAFFSSDNTFLVTEDTDTHARAWDLATGEPLTPPLKARYDLRAPAPTKADLPIDTRPTSDLVALAQLLSGSRVDETGAFRPLETSELINAWEKLRKIQPTDFNTSADDVLAWHDQEAKSYEQAWNWWAALFHLHYLVAANQNDQGLQQRHTFARVALDHAATNKLAIGYRKKLQVIPPRPPLAPVETVDLSDYYNRSLKEGGNSLANIPSGLQSFGGTIFDVRGIIHLAGQKQTTAGEVYRERVDAIKIGRKCKELHFLHGAGRDTKYGIEIGHYIVHYADDQIEKVPIVYGKDVRDWWTGATLGEPLFADNSTLAWMGTNSKVQSDVASRSLRLFKSTRENPRPDVEIVCVDFISNMSRAAPFLVAITAN